MITPTQCCDYFDLMACHMPPRYPLLPAGPSRPAQQYAIGLKLRLPLGVRECTVMEAQYRNDRWWYAFEIHPGCRKWYAEASLKPAAYTGTRVIEHKGVRFKVTGGMSTAQQVTVDTFADFVLESAANGHPMRDEDERKLA